jgi:hypothetical protein
VVHTKAHLPDIKPPLILNPGLIAFSSICCLYAAEHCKYNPNVHHALKNTCDCKQCVSNAPENIGKCKQNVAGAAKTIQIPPEFSSKVAKHRKLQHKWQYCQAGVSAGP